MSDYFLGEIRMFSFNWAPQDWALCQGQSMLIQQNAALNALLGKAFGGNATTFNLPDLRGRVPLCQGQSPISGTIYQQGSAYAGGAEGVTLNATQIPAHTHTLKAMSAQGAAGPSDGIISSLKTTVNPTVYGVVPPSGAALQPLNAGTVSTVGGAAHNNMQPFTVANFCIATSGIFPARN